MNVTSTRLNFFRIDGKCLHFSQGDNKFAMNSSLKRSLFRSDAYPIKLVCVLILRQSKVHRIDKAAFELFEDILNSYLRLIAYDLCRIFPFTVNPLTLASHLEANDKDYILKVCINSDSSQTPTNSTPYMSKCPRLLGYLIQKHKLLLHID